MLLSLLYNVHNDIVVVDRGPSSTSFAFVLLLLLLLFLLLHLSFSFYFYFINYLADLRFMLLTSNPEVYWGRFMVLGRYWYLKLKEEESDSDVR